MIIEEHAEVLPWTYWDSLEFKRNEDTGNQWRMFIDPIGVRQWSDEAANKPKKRKTHVDTNMHQCGMLDQPNHFNIVKVSTHYSKDNNELDNERFADIAKYELWLRDKLMHTLPMSFFQDFKSVRLPLGTNPIGCHIRQGEFFGVTISMKENFIPIKGDFKFTFFLHGVLSRSVR